LKLRDLYAKPGLTCSIEFFPPKTAEGDAALFREVETLKTLKPAFCSVTYGAGGSTRDKTLEVVTTLQSLANAT
jgi:methylenetetrahydrofolate reductase (NADPH)